MRSLAERLRAFEQQKARLAHIESKLKLAEKKARNRRLVETGIFVEKAGLSELSSATLFGALLSLKSGSQNSKQLEQWASAGERALESHADIERPEPIVLTFPETLDKEAAVGLRSMGFRFNKVLRHWEGMGNFEEAEDLATELGGRARKVSYAAE